MSIVNKFIVATAMTSCLVGFVAPAAADSAYVTDTALLDITASKFDVPTFGIALDGPPMSIVWDFSSNKFVTLSGQKLTMMLHAPKTSAYTSLKLHVADVGNTSAHELVSAAGDAVKYNLYLSENTSSSNKYQIDHSGQVNTPFIGGARNEITDSATFMQAGLSEIVPFIGGAAIGAAKDIVASTTLSLESSSDATLPDSVYRDTPRLYVKAVWNGYTM